VADVAVTVEQFDPLLHMTPVLAIENESFGADAYTQRFFEELHRKRKHTFLVALRENCTVGYVSAYMTTQGIGYIASLAVACAHRRVGIGELLITETVSRITTRHLAREIWLHVRRSNAAAIALYKKCGFRVSRFLRDYYPDGEPAALMTLNITAPDALTRVPIST
jgi:ribosomal-protein-alanine acetyltransferase